jgi:hypothetical protein
VTSETEVPLTATADGQTNGNGDARSLGGPESATSNRLSQTDDMDARIRQRAYEIYQARGYSSGNELEDWLEAERQVRSSSSSSSQTDDRTSEDATA